MAAGRSPSTPAQPCTSDLLIVGEPGSGKETAALARATGDVVVFDCRAVPGVLAESVLFGHVRSMCFHSGGGSLVKRGVFEGTGTVILDELAALPVEVFRGVLRVLEQRKVRRVGENVVRPVDVRVIATTSTPDALPADIRDAFPLEVLAPLRDRLADVAPEVPALHARLARLPLDVETVRRVAEAPDPAAAVVELELLAAIADSPDDAPRRVYADFLLERGDPRGELIHLQCDKPRSRRVRELLAVYGDTWLAPALAVPHVTGATMRRGFVEVVHASREVARADDVLRRAVPTLR